MKILPLLSLATGKLLSSLSKRGYCPHCGDSMDSDDIVCQTCGYPDND